MYSQKVENQTMIYIVLQTWFRLRIELDIKVVIHCNNEPNATYNIELWVSALKILFSCFNDYILIKK